MKKVYETSTALEAHMVKNLLENEGVDSRIDGEYLQGGVGELQAIGAIRVVVEEDDYSKAREIIDEWESLQPDDDVADIKSTKTSSATNGFVLGVVLTIGVTYFISGLSITTDGIDYNADGVLDEKWTYQNGRLKETTIDRNRDGNIDVIYSYDYSGIIKTAKFDNNFDGAFEVNTFYKNGNAISEESDTNNNSIIDYRVNYKNGVWDNVEFIDEQSGKVRKRQFYKLNKLVSDDYDTNGDGVLDSHYEYDQYEERK
ncbi:MAG: DUF2007 domain-containing protein [Sulfuriflexus sp.]|nr:DUF2007 domain-containing protein [Sulfuriflexus sp.]